VDVKFLSLLRGSHEVVHTGKVVRVQQVLELLRFNRVVEFGQVVVGHYAVEFLKASQVLHLLFSVLHCLAEPILYDGGCAIQSLEWVLHINDKLLDLLCLESPYIAQHLPKNSISSFSLFIDSIWA
jgi:hypothetical protein